jgi:DNA-binding CsgD family transcriptional regulator
MRTQQTLVAQIIDAIGEPDFVPIAAETIRRYIAFDLVAIVTHGPAAQATNNSRPALLFDNFAVADGHPRWGFPRYPLGRRGMENYLDVTYAVNPILVKAVRDRGVFRARDFTIRATDLEGNLASYLVKSADEELGFRTVGWPERLEEVGLYFETGNELVELSLYRQRGTRALGGSALRELENLRAPLAAAFNKHAVFRPRDACPAALLSPREMQITELLLQGYASAQIAQLLGISRHTVKDHRKQIFRKLGIGALAQLFALSRRLTSVVSSTYPLPGGMVPLAGWRHSPHTNNPGPVRKQHALRPDAD